MKKKKLKMSFSSLLEGGENILDETPSPSEIQLTTESMGRSLFPDKVFIERLGHYQPGDLIEGVELLEQLEQIITGGTLEEGENSILKEINNLLTSVVKDGKMDEYTAVKSLLKKLTGGEPKKVSSVKKENNLEKSQKIHASSVPSTIVEEPAGNMANELTVTVEDADIMSSFLQEAKEHLADIEEKILKFEIESNAEILNTIFRSVHTIKGTSAFLDINSVKILSHRLEFLLDDLRKGELKNSSPVIDLLLEATDLLGIMIDEIAEKFFASKTNRFTIPSHSKDRERIEKKFESIFQKKNINTGKEKSVVTAVTPKVSGELIPEDISTAFAVESSDLLDESEQILLQLEGEKGANASIDTIFRNIHTIKGNAGFLGFANVEKLAMSMESTLNAIRKNKRKKVGTGVISTLLRTIDIIKKSIAEPNISSDESVAQIKALGEILIENGKIAQEDLEKALDIQEMKVGEILLTEKKISRNDLSAALQKQSEQKQTNTGRTMAVAERKDIRVDMLKIDKLFDLMGELITAEDIIIHNPQITRLKGLERSITYLSKITREMQEITMSIRMIPLEGLFNKMRRLVRDLSKKVDKQADLHIFGQDTEMDKSVIEEIADPLIHIIRNSLDHGLENKNERLRKGKNETGKITLGARYDGNEIWVIIKDDGAGLNREKILSRAFSSGVIEQGAELSDEEVWSLIFAPGFSTSDVVTEVSGRGVGMDVVKSNIEKLRGKISIFSEKDKGTEIILKIPLTLAIMDGVTVRVGNIIFALPIGDIREFHKPQMDQITAAESGKEVLKLRDEIIPVIKLAEIFSQNSGIRSIDEGILLVVEANDRKAAFLVDEIISYQQIVVKGLPESLKGIKSVSGCSIMGNGEVNLILDSGSLINDVLV